MAEERVALTREGRNRLREELTNLQEVRRPELAAALEQARESNLSTEDDPGYELVKEDQAAIETRIAVLEDMIARADLIDEDASARTGRVELGTTVVVKGDDGPEHQYQIVGSMEVDVSRGKISSESPVGRALMGRTPGETIEVSVPNGKRRLTIVSMA